MGNGKYREREGNTRQMLYRTINQSQQKEGVNKEYVSKSM